MIFRLRVWLPLVAVLIVLLTIATTLAFGLPAARARLAEYSEQSAAARAAAVADAVENVRGAELEEALGPIARAAGGELLVVDESGRILARGGPELLPGAANETLLAAASGERTVRKIGEQRAATVPLIRDGSLVGGVVFAPDGEAEVLDIISRSDVEAAIVATVLGGGLMLLLATLLSRRIERLTLGARSLESGDLSARLRPGHGDELGELATSFNSMAARLQESFGTLEEERGIRDAVLANLTEGVLAVAPDGRAIFANPTALNMVGLANAELPAALEDPWEEFSLRQAVERCARGETGDGECEEARVKGAETFLRVKLERVPAFDANSQSTGGVLVVIQDLSEGRRLEANQQRFLANAAHELKTPITTILGTADLLLTEDEDDPELRKRFLQRILTEAERMQRLSQTLLNLAKTGTDPRDPQPETLDLDAATREAAESMKPLAARAKIRLTVEGSGSLVSADGEWLQQAILSLVSNAIKHSENGGSVRLRLDGRAVTVEDEGEGIPEEDLPYVFERFYRGKYGSGGEDSGFGLGLPICKDLVERMGGEVSVRSARGAGTSVEIQLEEPEREEEHGI